MTPETSLQQPLQLREYIAVLRARRWTIAVTAAVTLFAALFVSLRMTPMYTSTARVLVKPIATTATVQAGAAAALSMDTEREVATSVAVAELAAKDLGSERAPGQLLNGLTVSRPSDTQVLQITFTDPSPLAAQRAAQAFADAYLKFKQKGALETSEGRRDSIQFEIEQLQKQIDRSRSTLNHAAPGSSAADLAENEISLASSQIALLRTELASLNTLDIDPGDVIQAASLPASPSSPDHVQNAALGLFVGLALGVGFAFLRERLDDRLRGREDLEEHIGAPTLVAIPKVADWRDRKETRLVAVSEPRGAAAEAYKTLRTSILFNAAQTGLKTLMVSSATAGEGKTTTAANLAAVLAQTGKRVILVSADLRKPRIRRFFDRDGHVVDTDRGLSNVLTGTETLQHALQPTSVKGLWLLDSGPVPANPAEMAQSSAMATLLEALRDSADFTIIDTAPALVVTDALAMAPHVDGILYVASAGTTTRQAISRARVQLDQVGGRIIGAVLNGFDPSKSGSYTYEYSYRYVYRYHDEETEPRREGVQR